MATLKMATPEPAAGAFEGDAFLFPIRVYYEDTDSFGIVYHANYLRFAERARSEMLRATGTDNVRLRRDHDLVFVVRRCVIEFRLPARLDDALVVATQVRRIAGASFVVDHTIRRDGEVLVEVEAHVACITGAGRPKRLPARLRAALAATSDDRQR